MIDVYKRQPLALKGVSYRPAGAASLLKRNILIYGVGLSLIHISLGCAMIAGTVCTGEETVSPSIASLTNMQEAAIPSTDTDWAFSFSADVYKRQRKSFVN